MTLLLAPAAAQTVFPSDSHDPRQAGGVELIESVCPGRVAGKKELTCRIACPHFTGFSGEPFGWSLSRVTRGHFLSPTSEDAALWMDGCEPHSENWGGTILMTRHSNRWVMLWYKAGVVTERCHKVPLRNGREILVCMGTYGGQGLQWTALYVEDLLSPAPVMMAGDEKKFFQVLDTTSTCGYDALAITRAFIERVEFKVGSAGRQSISVTADSGTRATNTADVKACIAAQNRKGHEESKFLPPTKRYHIDFLFDGHNYKVAPASTAAARIFEER